MDALEPVLVLRNAIDVGCGMYHTCAQLVDGSVTCWGNSLYGQTGSGANATLKAPGTIVNIGTAITGLHVGGTHNCVLTTNGQTKCWGSNFYGELSLSINSGNYSSIGNKPRDMPPHDSIVQRSHPYAIALGSAMTCWLFDDGNSNCVGQGDYGSLGYGNVMDYGANVSTTPSPFHAFRAIEIEHYYDTMCITTNVSMACYGPNNYGELGTNTTTAYGKYNDDWQPVYVLSNITTWALIGSSPGGHNQICALALWTIQLSNGSITIPKLWCWGDNSYSQLGMNDTSSLLYPPMMPINWNCGDGIVQIHEGEECDGSKNCTANCTFVPLTPLSCAGTGPPGSVCVNTTWYYNDSIVVDTDIEVISSLYVDGNLTFTNTSTLHVTETTHITAKNCVILQGSLNMTFYDVPKVLTSRMISSKCLSGRFKTYNSDSEVINVKCWKYRVKSDVFGLLVVFENSCEVYELKLSLSIGLSLVVLMLVGFIAAGLCMLYRKHKNRKFFKDGEIEVGRNYGTLK
jgi:alpha-tubulin suppressor-like RCC1 family protein